MSIVVRTVWMLLAGCFGETCLASVLGLNIARASGNRVAADLLSNSDLGGDYFTRRDPERQTKRLVRQLERLGHAVTLQEVQAA